MSTRTSNLAKKKLPCLRCGHYFWTDRCHRICKRCNANAGNIFVKPMLSAEGITVLSDFPLVEELGLADELVADDETVTMSDDRILGELGG